MLIVETLLKIMVLFLLLWLIFWKKWIKFRIEKSKKRFVLKKKKIELSWRRKDKRYHILIIALNIFNFSWIINDIKKLFFSEISFFLKKKEEKLQVSNYLLRDRKMLKKLIYQYNKLQNLLNIQLQLLSEEVWRLKILSKPRYFNQLIFFPFFFFCLPFYS